MRLIVVVGLLAAACGGSGGGTTPPVTIDESKPLGIISAGTTFSAAFLPNGSAFVCAQTTFGACTFFNCTPRTSDMSPPDVALNPGVLTISDGTSSKTRAPDAQGEYDAETIDPFADGATLTVSAPGGGIPAFSIKGKVPKEAKLSAPTLVRNHDFIVDRATAIDVAWTGLTATEKLSVLIGTTLSDFPMEVECLFDGDAGSGVVSADALAALPVGDGYYEVQSKTEADAIIASSSWQLQLKLGTNAGSGAVGTATIQ